MAITNYPKVLKYIVGDRAYTYPEFYVSLQDFGYVGGFKNDRANGFCQRVKITGWRTVVTDSNGDGTGTPVQTDYYTVKKITGYSTEVYATAEELYDETEYEIPAEKLFTSKNHLISTIKGKYINSPFGDLEDDANLFFSKMGNIGAYVNSNGDWIDWAGMNFKDMNFTEAAFNSTWAGGFVGGETAGTKTLVIDNCNFEGSPLPAGYTTRGLFRGLVYSYDAETTLFKDGYPIGRAMTGTAAGSESGSTVTGSSTLFTSQLSEGDQIIITDTGVFTVASIASDTSLTVEETFEGDFSGKTISRL